MWNLFGVSEKTLYFWTFEAWFSCFSDGNTKTFFSIKLLYFRQMRPLTICLSFPLQWTLQNWKCQKCSHRASKILKTFLGEDAQTWPLSFLQNTYCWGCGTGMKVGRAKEWSEWGNLIFTVSNANLLSPSAGVRVLIPPGYLHPGKGTHKRSLKFINNRGPTCMAMVHRSWVVILIDLKI
jgi:hypothetical protein